MERFEFRLDRVLKIRQQLERLAELRQQQAHAALTACQARVESLQKQLADAAAAAGAQVGQVVEASAWLDHVEQAARLGRMIQGAEEEARKAAERLREAAAARAKAAQETEVLLSLRSRKLETHQRQAMREQQDEADETVLRRWMNDDARGSGA